MVLLKTGSEAPTAYMVEPVASRPRFGCYSQLPTGAYWGLLGPNEAYRGLPMPTMISVSIWLPVSSLLSACYCLPGQALCTLVARYIWVR